MLKNKQIAKCLLLFNLLEVGHNAGKHSCLNEKKTNRNHTGFEKVLKKIE